MAAEIGSPSSGCHTGGLACGIDSIRIICIDGIDGEVLTQPNLCNMRARCVALLQHPGLA